MFYKKKVDVRANLEELKLLKQTGVYGYCYCSTWYCGAHPHIHIVIQYKALVHHNLITPIPPRMIKNSSRNPNRKIKEGYRSFKK